ncbi:Uncharacterised protein [Mycobacterium tuberculosis]|nr:Uncharacterised protein [Mycobacterium tuberculosis]
MVEYGAAPQQRFPAGVVGRVKHPILVEEQRNRVVLGYPAPGLAVVERRCAAGQLHRALDDIGGHHGVRHDQPPLFDITPIFLNGGWQTTGSMVPKWITDGRGQMARASGTSVPSPGHDGLVGSKASVSID